jgi:hypothetical protein
MLDAKDLSAFLEEREGGGRDHSVCRRSGSTGEQDGNAFDIERLMGHDS